MPSRDTHSLRDDFALADKPLRTQYIQSPAKDLSEDSGKTDFRLHCATLLTSDCLISF